MCPRLFTGLGKIPLRLKRWLQVSAMAEPNYGHTTWPAWAATREGGLAHVSHAPALFNPYPTQASNLQPARNTGTPLERERVSRWTKTFQILDISGTDLRAGRVVYEQPDLRALSNPSSLQQGTLGAPLESPWVSAPLGQRSHKTTARFRGG